MGRPRRPIVKKTGRSDLRSRDEDDHELQRVAQGRAVTDETLVHSEQTSPPAQQEMLPYAPSISTPSIHDNDRSLYFPLESTETWNNAHTLNDMPNSPHDSENCTPLPNLNPPIRESAILEQDRSNGLTTIHFDASLETTDLKDAYYQYRASMISPWRPCLFFTLPIGAAPLVLLILIWKYRVPATMSIFSNSTRIDGKFVLVNIEDTRLMFVASALSYLAPLVAAYIMSLYAPKIVRKLKDSTPLTIYEFKLLSALCQASDWQLLKAWSLRCHSSGPVNEALKFAMHTYFKLFILWLMTYGALGLLHLTTRMVDYNQITVSSQYLPGRGLTESCLTFDREVNQFPCSFNLGDPNWALQQKEQFRLHRNSS